MSPHSSLSDPALPRRADPSAAPEGATATGASSNGAPKAQGPSKPAAQTRASRGGPLSTLLGVQVAAIGSYAPDWIVRNEDLAEHGYDADWIIQRTGIRARRKAREEQATSDLCYEAAKVCLERAGISGSEVDLVIVGTFTPDQAAPTTACRLQHRLGASAPAMDINAACSGFIYALVTGMQFVKTGAAKRALVVGADVCSRICNPADKKTYPLFGDAAGAVLLTPGSAQQGLLSYELGADGSGGDLLSIPAGGTREPLTAEGIAGQRQYLQMDGRSVFKWAVRTAAESIRAVAEHAKLSLQQIDHFVLHQANRRIIDAVAQELNLPAERLVINVDQYGTTSAGSIPLALDEAAQSGRIRRGQTVMLCGFGAGLTWGSAILVW